jgi:hypothetical protein
MKNNKCAEIDEELSRRDFKAEFPYYRWLRQSALKASAPSLTAVEQSDTYCLAADVEDFLQRRLNGASRVFNANWGNGHIGLCIWLSITDEEYWLLGCKEAPDDKQKFLDELKRLRDENPAKFRQAAEQLIEAKPRPATLYY